MNHIAKITQAPACTVALAEKINESAQALTPLLNLKAGHGIKITSSPSDITVSLNDGAGRNRVPSGYEEQAVSLCVVDETGATPPTSIPGSILFKRITPPPAP